MSIKVRPYRGGPGWEVDIIVRLPDGTLRRERKKVTETSKGAAKRWAEQRERELLRNGVPVEPKEVPTLREFEPRFMSGYVNANRLKPSGVAGKISIFKVHLVPLLGMKKLDAITNEDVQQLKHHLRAKSPKTVNNTLTVLNVALRTAVEWNVVDRMPCTIRLLPIPKGQAQFHDFNAYERLVSAAGQIDRNTQLLVLLGGDAGLRCGEMMALTWKDVDLEKRTICVQRSDWKGHVTIPKGGRLRYVRMTARLEVVLRAHRSLRGKRVICQRGGEPFTQKMVQDAVRRAARRAGVEHETVHVLRHTFCSRLAMLGAPARAIQELAGHQDLSTTQRYMHLSPAAVEGAIRLLDGPLPAWHVETAATGDVEK
jgi:integrase